MEFTTLSNIITNTLSMFSVVILIGAIILTVKTNFIQFRGIGKIFKLLMKSITSGTESDETIKPHKALFTAMSTTIGMAVIAAPVVTIQLAGPGALIYFLITNLLGSAVVFAEVTLAVKYRKQLEDGTIMGGPMQYIKEALSSSFATFYALIAFILLLIWSSLQANTMADLLINYNIPTWTSGMIMAALIIGTLLGGIKRIGNLSEKMVPFMFFLYSTSGLYIIFANFSKLPEIIDLVIRSAITPSAFIGGTFMGGLIHILRTGLLKGFNANESGLGMAAIPHSMAQTKDPSMQGLLSMLSLYSHGFLCLISGLIVLLTGTWQDPTLRFGISPIAHSFYMYFSSPGIFILTVSAALFIFGTILGNSFYGEQCLKYLSKRNLKHYFYILIAMIIMIGSVSPVRNMWLLPDFFVVLVALPNIIGILILAFKHKNILNIK